MLNACAPGIPRLVNSLTIPPIVVASAFSSKFVSSSNHFSTLAELFVPSPMSISAVPSTNAPRGMSIRPAPIPASILSIVPTLFVGPPIVLDSPPPIFLCGEIAIPPLENPTRPPFSSLLNALVDTG